MVDFEQIAATLAAALIKPVDGLTGSKSPGREKRIAEAAAHGVAIYHAVLIEIVRQQARS